MLDIFDWIWRREWFERCVLDWICVKVKEVVKGVGNMLILIVYFGECLNERIRI